MEYIIKLLLFLVIFLTIVLVHEGGHFIIAKKSGIDVKEFMIGFGPTIYKREFGETTYSVRLLPFGGACVFDGLDPSEPVSSPTAYLNASVYSRIATVSAGPISNFLLAFFLSLFLIGSIGYDPPVIEDVMDGYPAQEAGLRGGDEIKQIDGQNIVIYRDIRSYTMFFEGKSATVKYQRDGKTYETVITPRYDAETGRYLFGFYGASARQKAGPISVIRYSAHEVWYWIDLTYKSLGMVFQGRVTKDDFGGPVAVAQTVSDVYDEAREDGLYYIWLNMLNITILLTANLGVMNLLPIPALDGGKLVFLLIELVRRKKIDPEREALIHFAGVMVLLAFMIFVMCNDITRFFR